MAQNSVVLINCILHLQEGWHLSLAWGPELFTWGRNECWRPYHSIHDTDDNTEGMKGIALEIDTKVAKFQVKT